MSKYGIGNCHASISKHGTVAVAYQVLCYCSLAKPGPGTKSKSLHGFTVIRVWCVEGLHKYGKVAMQKFSVEGLN